MCGARQKAQLHQQKDQARPPRLVNQGRQIAAQLANDDAPAHRDPEASRVASGMVVY
jgi:hypothetical protein